MLDTIEVRWFTSATVVGMVLCGDITTGKTKCYIGAGAGLCGMADTINIKNYGAKVPKKMAEAVFGTQPYYAWK